MVRVVQCDQQQRPAPHGGSWDEESYSEGIEVGCRWYDAHNVKPLFRFGFGLGYTPFSYSDLAVHRIRGGHDGLDVSFKLRNTASRAGQEVPQVYLGAHPEVSASQAVRALAGYDKLTLRPGETQARAHPRGGGPTQVLDTAKHNWAIGAGARRVFVGSSSANLPLRTTVGIN
jgi:beta-glucosidase